MKYRNKLCCVITEWPYACVYVRASIMCRFDSPRTRTHETHSCIQYYIEKFALWRLHYHCQKTTHAIVAWSREMCQNTSRWWDCWCGDNRKVA